jgi:hypothetical protein
MNKKGAMELSVNMIVILVLAMTLLGLGITITRYIVDRTRTMVEDTFSKIEEELTSKLDTGDDDVVFSKTQLNVPRGSEKLEGFGIRNQGNQELKLGIHFFAVDCPGTCDQDDVESWFTYIKGNEKYVVKPGERMVKDVLIKIPKTATTGLYLIQLAPYRGTSCTVNSCSEMYGSTEIFLTVG